MPRTSIVIVTWNGRDLMERCLGPVVAQATDYDAEVVVVDNASVDGSVEYIRGRFPGVVLVRNARNEGYAEGCNVGVRAAQGDIIVLLNNDALPRSEWLGALVAPLDRPNVAISCSVVYEPRYHDAYALGTGGLSVIGHPIPNAARDPGRPFYATGCSLAFRRSLLGEPFDPLFFAYYEDTQLSWRARLAGYEVVRAVGSGVDHLGSITAQRQPSLMQYYWERNKLLTLLTCYETTTIVRLAGLYAFDGLARVAEDAWLLMKRPRPPGRTVGATVARYRATLQAWGWLIGHAGLVRNRRAPIQSRRSIPDAEITAQLSGKIFDDVVPTRGHRAANAIAQSYCRWVGIPTAEADSKGRKPAGGRMVASR